MKNLLIFFALYALSSTLSIAQENEEEIKINFLKAPSSPGASILGFSPSEIQTPTDPSAFMLSFQNSTNSFTSLPKSFAVDIAPFWFFNGKNQKYSEFKSNKLTSNLKQSFVISVAYRDSSNKISSYSKNSFIGFGAKVSLFRGREEKISSFFKIVDKLDSLYTLEVDKNPKLLLINKSLDSWESQKDTISFEEMSKQAILLEEYLKEQFYVKNKDLYLGNKQTKNEIESSESLRTGFKWDIAGGFSYRYPDNNYSKALTYKGGMWSTLGYDWKSKYGKGNWSVLNITRLLKNPDQPWADTEGILKGVANVSTFDFGFKASFLKENTNTYSASLELLYRSILNNSQQMNKIEPSYKLAFNGNYEINKNMVLTLGIGRDFDGSILKDGNVFAFLNLITAFGSGTKIIKN
jgi:hypothetical protein